MREGRPAVDNPGEGSVEPAGMHIDDVFDTTDEAPYETQRRISRYLSQETRHHITSSPNTPTRRTRRRAICRRISED